MMKSVIVFKSGFLKNNIACLLVLVGLFVMGATASEHGSGTQKIVCEHQEAGETCFICDKTKREKGRLWCKEHGRYEDRCWYCHPDLEDKSRLYCGEHGIYEDECFICHPELLEENKKDSVRLGKSLRTSSEPALFCNEHQVLESECGICQPQLADDLQPGQSMKLRFASELSAKKAGIGTASPEHKSSSSSVEAFCEVGYNENKLAHITSIVQGVVRHVLADVGAHVQAGDVLVEIHSSEISKAKADYLSARAEHKLKEIAYKREKRLVDLKISAAREYEEAVAIFEVSNFTVDRARQNLLNHGFTSEEISSIERTNDSSSTLRIRAPFSGTLIDRHVVAGEKIDSNRALFKLADLSDMWLDLSIPVDQSAYLKVGSQVKVAFDGFPQDAVIGDLVWIDTAIDERSRTLKARAISSSGKGFLKAGMFGKAQIFDGRVNANLFVPRNAVQSLDGKQFLFVKVEDDLYDLRRISLGNETDTTIEITAGIDEGDEVVVAGAFIAMSEFLKSRLGAGCVHD